MDCNSEVFSELINAEREFRKKSREIYYAERKRRKETPFYNKFCMMGNYTCVFFKRKNFLIINIKSLIIIDFKINRQPQKFHQRQYYQSRWLHFS